MYVPVGTTAQTIAWYDDACALSKEGHPALAIGGPWYCKMAEQLREVVRSLDPAPPPPAPPPGAKRPPEEITRGTAYEEWFRQAEEAKEREKTYMVYGALALGALLLWKRGR